VLKWPNVVDSMVQLKWSSLDNSLLQLKWSSVDDSLVELVDVQHRLMMMISCMEVVSVHSRAQTS